MDIVLVMLPIVINGDIELLKTIDYTLISKTEIYDVINQTKLQDKSLNNAGVKECLKFLVEKVGADFVKETSDNMICNYCKYHGFSRKYKTHKVKLTPDGDRIVLCSVLDELVTTLNNA
jgi:hypothetical protein